LTIPTRHSQTDAVDTLASPHRDSSRAVWRRFVVPYPQVPALFPFNRPVFHDRASASFSIRFFPPPSPSSWRRAERYRGPSFFSKRRRVIFCRTSANEGRSSRLRLNPPSLSPSFFSTRCTKTVDTQTRCSLLLPSMSFLPSENGSGSAPSANILAAHCHHSAMTPRAYPFTSPPRPSGPAAKSALALDIVSERRLNLPNLFSALCQTSPLDLTVGLNFNFS